MRNFDIVDFDILYIRVLCVLRNIIFMKNGNKQEIRLESLVCPCIKSVTGY